MGLQKNALGLVSSFKTLVDNTLTIARVIIHIKNRLFFQL